MKIAATCWKLAETLVLLELMVILLDMSASYTVIVLGVFQGPNPGKACSNLSDAEDVPTDEGS